MDPKYNVVVIGAGSAGLISAYMSAAVKARVALIERHKMGGDCLNTGCVPSKALIRTARFVHDLRRHQELGVAEVQFRLDFAQIMQRVQDKVAAIEPHDSIERYTGLGVECYQGDAQLDDLHRVRLGDRTFSTKNIILAVGASPIIPPLPGMDRISPLSSDNLWQLRTLPQRLVVLGGGPIGCEMAQAFHRLGSSVTQIEMMPRLLSKEDPDMAELVVKRMRAEGVTIRTSTRAVRIEVQGGEKQLVVQGPNGPEERVPFDELLCAVGRRPNTQSFDWQKFGIELNPNGTFKTDAYLRTSQAHIFAAGDCAGPFQLTHAASHQAWYCAMNALFAPLVRFKADYRVLPWCTFTDPELAQVGLNETMAKEQGLAYEVTHYDMSDLDRAITESEDYGAIKVLTVPGKDRILGVSICSHLAGELIGPFALAMKHGLGLRKILGTVHAYPTFIEANKAVAGAWTRPRVPQWALRFLTQYHAFRRR
jgi:pyruvate/2-oxoglutarate dehydrogenase complex dihydrolipoamide dehydrogenase (E3) component